MRKLTENTERGIEMVKDMEEQLYTKNLIYSGLEEGQKKQKPKDIITLEMNLLRLGACPQQCQGLFYMFPVNMDDGTIYLR